MSRYLKAVVHILLLIAAIQVFNLNTAECATMSTDGSVTVNHTITYVAAHCFEAGSLHDIHRDKPAGHHPRKPCRKYFPGKVMVSTGQKLPALLYQEMTLRHYTEVAAYRYLYFKSINPPPSKA